jgi:hypothetical protein
MITPPGPDFIPSACSRAAKGSVNVLVGCIIGLCAHHRRFTRRINQVTSTKDPCGCVSDSRSVYTAVVCVF